MDIAELAEACRDAVDDFIPAHPLFHGFPRGFHVPSGGWREGNFRAGCRKSVNVFYAKGISIKDESIHADALTNGWLMYEEGTLNAMESSVRITNANFYNLATGEHPAVETKVLIR